MSNILGGVHLLVAVVVGQTLLGGTNVDLVVLVLQSALHDTGQNPGSRAESSPLKEEGNNQEKVGDRVVQEGNGEGRSSQLPGDGSQDGGDDGSVESIVQEGLGSVGDSEDVVALTGGDVQSSNGSNQEETEHNSELTANHESGQVLSVTLEEKLACLASEEGSSTLVGRKLGNSEEGNLHTLKHTNNGHEEEEKEDGNTGGHAGVLGGNLGLSVEQGNKGDSQAESKDGKRHEHTSPEEGEGESSAGLLVGDDGLARSSRQDVLDEVGRVHDSRELDKHGGVEGEKGEVVVDEVNHAVGGVHLGGELSKDASEDHHTQSNIQENKLHSVRQAKDIALGVEGSGALVDDEDDHKNHELTSHEVTVQVVSLEGQGSVLVGHGVRVLVEIGIDGRKSNKRCLLSLNHTEPYNSEDTDDKSDPWVGRVGDTGVSSEDEGTDDDDTEDQQCDTGDVTEDGEGGELDVVRVISDAGLLGNFCFRHD